MRTFTHSVIVASILFTSAAASAQRAPQSGAAEPIGTVKVLTFDPQAIEGAPRSGNADLIQEPPRLSRHRSLVRLREEFRRELLGSVFSL